MAGRPMTKSVCTQVELPIATPRPTREHRVLELALEHDAAQLRERAILSIAAIALLAKSLQKNPSSGRIFPSGGLISA